MSKKRRPLEGERQTLKVKDDAPVALLAHATMHDGRPWVMSLAGASRTHLAKLIKTLNHMGGVADQRVASRQPVSVLDLEIPKPNSADNGPCADPAMSPLVDAVTFVKLALHRLAYEDDLTIPTEVAQAITDDPGADARDLYVQYADRLACAVSDAQWDTPDHDPPMDIDEPLFDLIQCLRDMDEQKQAADITEENDEGACLVKSSDSELSEHLSRVFNSPRVAADLEENAVTVHFSQEYEDALEAERADPKPYHNPHALRSATDPDSPVSKLPGNRRKYRPAPKSTGMTTPSDQLPAKVDPREWYAKDHPKHPDNLDNQTIPPPSLLVDRSLQRDPNDPRRARIVEQIDTAQPDPERWTDPMPKLLDSAASALLDAQGKPAPTEINNTLKTLKTSIITALDLLTTPELPALQAATQAMQAQLPPCCVEFAIRCAILGIEPHQAGAMPDPHKQPTNPNDHTPHRCPACSNLIFDLTKPVDA